MADAASGRRFRVTEEILQVCEKHDQQRKTPFLNEEALAHSAAGRCAAVRTGYWAGQAPAEGWRHRSITDAPAARTG